MSENGNSVASFHDNYRERVKLGDLKLKRVLSDNADRKMTVVEAEVEGSSDPAVIVLDKLPFTEQALSGILSQSTGVENELQNDIYGQYRLHPDPVNNPVKANIIHPATQKHIEKYTSSPSHIVHESEELYQTVTLPFIQSEQFSLNWVYNILDKKKEQDRIIYENVDPVHGFLMAPDFKWTGKQVEDLYVLAIVHRRGIKSLRDLNRSHLPLLRNLLHEGKAAIQEKYALPKSKIRCYLHYQPSYYHLHVHYTNLEYNAPGINCEKSHMLESVISNIERNGSHYQTAVLNFVVNEKSKLYKAYLDQGYFKESMEDSEHFLEKEFEAGSCDKVLQFLEMIGRAKHEPSGEMWETTYGESAWRMAVLSLCLPANINRMRLMRLSLVSSLCSLGTSNDENTVWDTKLTQVKEILRSQLPAKTANQLFGLFAEHVEVKRGRLNGSAEHAAYRALLELEEVLLRWEEEGRCSDKEMPRHVLLSRMAKLQFPGSYKFVYLKEKEELDKFLTFVLKISGLMKLKRTGWVKCQVRDPETVAGHMYRMGILGILFSHQEEKVKCEKLLGFRGDASVVGICHDMAECIIGDITPHCKVSPEEKAEKEMSAFKELIKDLPETVGMDLIIPFSRYENQETDDFNAILTKDYDKFDMILQAFEYEKKEKRGPFLQQFFDSTMTCFQTQAVKKWQRSLLEARDKYFSDTAMATS